MFTILEFTRSQIQDETNEKKVLVAEQKAKALEKVNSELTLKLSSQTQSEAEISRLKAELTAAQSKILTLESQLKVSIDSN